MASQTHITLVNAKSHKPTTSQVDRGNTTPVLGRTEYFFGLVVFTWIIKETVKQEIYGNDKSSLNIYLHFQDQTISS